ncbi:MAG TPA: glycosyltransferase [Solibacterales bacterium]|nr:glycosyltransferase [Bryobacterales bacterium]
MISIVIPIYNEEEIIPTLIDEIEQSMAGLETEWEALFVDDGSVDGSLAALLHAQSRNPNIVVIELSRNWGHQTAISAGLEHARGDAVVVMDGDLQDPPAVIPALVSAWKSGFQVVIAERGKRGEGLFRRICFRCFYRLLGWVSDFPIPLNAGMFGLLDRQAVDAITLLSETNRYLPGLRAWIGFPTKIVMYDRSSRAAGEPKQHFGRLFRYAFDAIFSFSYKPLRFSLFMGVATAIFSMIAAVVLTTFRIMGVGIFGGPVVVGYTSTLVSILFLGGVQLIGIGILGEYLGRVFDEVKRRPLYFIRRVHGGVERRTGLR